MTVLDRIRQKLEECETVRGHDLQPDNDFSLFGGVDRWTCANPGCECVALRAIGASHVYGSATMMQCTGATSVGTFVWRSLG